MKVLCFAVAALVVCAGFAAETAKPVKVKRSPEEIAKLREMAERRRYEKLGGMVSQPIVGKVLRIVCATDYADAKTLDARMQSMRSATGMPVEVVTTNRDCNAAATVTIMDDTAADSLLIAPESGWAKVNIRSLMRDAPDKDKLMGRLAKEVWRAMALLLGAGYSDIQPDVMSLVTDARQLDAIKAETPIPYTYNRMIDTATKLGVHASRSVSYRQACMEGWAPEPKDDVQRKIRDEVEDAKKKAPGKPIKIKFDPAKDK